MVDGQYQELQPTPQGWLWSQQLGLYLGLHERQLWFFTAEGERVLLPEESMERALQQERQRTERLAEKLRALGINPDE